MGVGGQGEVAIGLAGHGKHGGERRNVGGAAEDRVVVRIGAVAGHCEQGPALDAVQQRADLVDGVVLVQ
ncbi:hypothetical protein D3C72_1729060 [compost metagenome]